MLLQFVFKFKGVIIVIMLLKKACEEDVKIIFWWDNKTVFHIINDYLDIPYSSCGCSILCRLSTKTRVRTDEFFQTEIWRTFYGVETWALRWKFEIRHIGTRRDGHRWPDSSVLDRSIYYYEIYLCEWSSFCIELFIICHAPRLNFLFSFGPVCSLHLFCRRPKKEFMCVELAVFGCSDVCLCRCRDGSVGSCSCDDVVELFVNGLWMGLRTTNQPWMRDIDIICREHQTQLLCTNNNDGTSAKLLFDEVDSKRPRVIEELSPSDQDDMYITIQAIRQWLLFSWYSSDTLHNFVSVSARTVFVWVTSIIL